MDLPLSCRLSHFGSPTLGSRASTHPFSCPFSAPSYGLHVAPKQAGQLWKAVHLSPWFHAAILVTSFGYLKGVKTRVKGWIFFL